MIISFDCPCGNTDPKEAKFYDGALGYEAIVCKYCGRYSDHFGMHDCDDWSESYIGKKFKKETSDATLSN